MDFYKHATPLGIGNTPLIPYEEDFEADIFVKDETQNATGSIKDRPALQMILQAEQDGLLQPGYTIVEATSGNMGISLAYIGAKRGYRVLLTMPDTMSEERRNLLQGLGAQLVLTEGALGMQGAVDMAEELASQPKHLLMRQFENPQNVQAHVVSTGEEIVNQIDNVDIFVAGIGTSGTLIGTAIKLKQAFPNCKIVGVEPASSPIISRGEKGQHAIQGIGAGFIPSILDLCLVDEVLMIDGDEAMETSRMLANTQGILAGISAGAAVLAAKQVASRPENTGKRIVVILPDTGERYLSTELFRQ